MNLTKYLTLLPLISLSLCGHQVISVDKEGKSKSETIMVVADEADPSAPVTEQGATVAPSRERQIAVANIDAPRLADQAGNNYSPRNLIDGNKNTAWSIPRDRLSMSRGFSEGPTVTFRNPEYITGIQIRNGYCKSATVYRNNTRPAYITVVRYPERSADFEKDVIYSGPLRDTMEPQRFKVNPKFDSSKPTKAVKIYFPLPDEDPGSFYLGEKYDDLCMTEFLVFGK